MKRIQALLAVGVVAFGFATSSTAQIRTLGANQLILDNGAGQTITLQTPAAGWTGNIPFLIPIPPPGNPNSGFTYAGTSANQLLTWVAPNTVGPAPNNYAGGVQGSWQPVTASALNIVTGTGTNNTIPKWTGATTQGNSLLTDNGNLLSYTGLGGFTVGGTTSMMAATVSSGLNITGGNLLMGGTSVLDQARNLFNINNISLAGSIGTATTITASGLVTGGSFTATTGYQIGGTATAANYLRGNGTHFVSSGIQVADVPTLNQNTTGTSSNVTGVVLIANGGTGQTTQQAAINALTGAQTNGLYLRSNGTNATLSALNGADLTAGTVPVAAINATGTADNTTFLRGDGVWATPPSGSGSAPTLVDNNAVVLGTILGFGGDGTVNIITSTGHILNIYMDPIGGNNFPINQMYWTGGSCGAGTGYLNDGVGGGERRYYKNLAYSGATGSLYEMASPNANNVSISVADGTIAWIENPNCMASGAAGGWAITPITQVAAGLPAAISYPLTVQ